MTITATLAVFANKRFKSVVLPAPKKPVNRVTAIGGDDCLAMATLRSCR